jgi:alpha/beta superfamily hydrolase
MDVQKVEFLCGSITLEGILAMPEGDGLFPLVVLCHPHPLYGGSMHNNVVDAVCGKVGEKKIAWLKFNFRGVGRSGGSFAGGIGEKEDAKAAISFGEIQPKVDPERMGLCGYSFGSIVAFSVAVEDPRIKAVAGISPFIQPDHLLDRYPRPKLFACGTQDDFVNPRTLEQVVQKTPEPKELAIYPGVDHFWVGQEEAMAEKVSQFFKDTLNPKSKNINGK